MLVLRLAQLHRSVDPRTEPRALRVLGGSQGERIPAGVYGLDNRREHRSHEGQVTAVSLQGKEPELAQP